MWPIVFIQCHVLCQRKPKSVFVKHYICPQYMLSPKRLNSCPTNIFSQDTVKGTCTGYFLKCSWCEKLDSSLCGHWRWCTRQGNCNHVALTDFCSWLELQHDAVEMKCFSRVFQESNHPKCIVCPEMHIFRVWYILMHLQGVVLVCDVSTVIENAWNKMFTMKSTRTGSYHNILKFLYFICLTYQINKT